MRGDGRRKGLLSWFEGDTIHYGGKDMAATEAPDDIVLCHEIERDERRCSTNFLLSLQPRTPVHGAALIRGVFPLRIPLWDHPIDTPIDVAYCNNSAIEMSHHTQTLLNLVFVPGF